MDVPCIDSHVDSLLSTLELKRTYPIRQSLAKCDRLQSRLTVPPSKSNA